MLHLMLVVLVIGWGATKPDPCDVGKGGFVSIDHRPGQNWTLCTVRLRSQRTLRVVVLHANPLAYTYAVEGVELASEDLSGPLKKLLGLEVAAKDATAAAAAKGRLPSPAGGADPTDFYGAIAQLDAFRNAVIEVVSFADAAVPGGPSPNPDLLDRAFNGQVHQKMHQALSGAPLWLQSRSAPAIEQKLNELFKKLSTAEQTALEAARKAAVDALPGLLGLVEQTEAFTQGPREFSYTYSAAGEVLVRVKVTYRLDALGTTPGRPVGVLDVAEIHPEFHRVRFSSGLMFDIAEDPTFRLQAHNNDNSAPFDVIGDSSTSRLKVTPSVLVNFMWPLGGVSRWGGGFSIGAGIKSTELRQIDDQTSLSLLATLGYESLLLSIGFANVSRPVGVQGVGSNNSTNDPNALNNLVFTRTWRLTAGMHLTF